MFFYVFFDEKPFGFDIFVLVVFPSNTLQRESDDVVFLPRPPVASSAYPGPWPPYDAGYDLVTVTPQGIEAAPFPWRNPEETGETERKTKRHTC